LNARCDPNGTVGESRSRELNPAPAVQPEKPMKWRPKIGCIGGRTGCVLERRTVSEVLCLHRHRQRSSYLRGIIPRSSISAVPRMGRLCRAAIQIGGSTRCSESQYGELARFIPDCSHRLQPVHPGGRSRISQGWRPTRGRIRRSFGRDVRRWLPEFGRIEDFRKIRKCRRQSFSSGDATRSCRHCFGGPPDRTNVITMRRQIMKICKELRIREDRLTYIPRASVGFVVASHLSEA
jgi:hypothetical protein